jgi:hypothetical protein
MSQPMNPYDPPEYNRPGMSGTAKVLLGVGIGCLVFLILCCGFFGFSGYMMARMAKNSIIKDPDEIRRVTADIVNIEIPASLPPMFGVDMKAPILGTTLITGAAYGDPEPGNALLLGPFAANIMDEETMRTQWRQSMRNSGRDDWEEDVDIQESETHETEVNGEPAKFKVARGKSRKQGEVWQVAGGFRGKSGSAFLIMKVKSDEFTKEQVLAILDSME